MEKREISVALLPAVFLVVYTVVIGVHNTQKEGATNMESEVWIGIGFAVFLAIIGISLPLIIGRNYKELQNELNILKESVEKVLAGQGVKSLDLTTQHDRIAGNLTADLAVRTNPIKEAITVLSVREEERDKRNELLSGDLRKLSDAVKRIDAFESLLEKVNAENLMFREQLQDRDRTIDALRAEIETIHTYSHSEEKPTGLIKSTERNLRSEERDKAGRRHKRGNDMDENEDRCREVYKAGAMPRAQLYRDFSDKKTGYSFAWRRFESMWQRPAATVAHMERGTDWRDYTT